MATTSTDIANEALVMAGWNKAAVTGVAPTFDNSTVGLILQRIYQPCVNAVLRVQPWDCARAVVSLTASGNTPPFGWSYEFLYPSNAVEVWQVGPPTGYSPNNPLPQLWDVGNSLISSVMTKVIWTNVSPVQAVFNNTPTEAIWDSLLRQAVVRSLAGELALALAKPEMTAFLDNSAKESIVIGSGKDR